MDEKIFQKIYDSIEPGLPAGWKKMIFRAEYFPDSYSFEYYYQKESGEYVSCFDTENDDELTKNFIKLNKDISSCRSSAGKSGKWTVFTLSVDSGGHFNADYVYDDIEERIDEYELEWEEKYLI